MRVVVDTNVLVSGLLSPGGFSAQVLGLIIEGSVELCVDERIMEEYRDVLTRPEWPFSAQDALVIVEAIRNRAIFFSPDPLPIALPDPDDRMFLEVALASRASAIITGNKRHFPHASAGRVKIFTPRKFVDRFEK